MGARYPEFTTYQINATVNHNLSNTDTIIAYWPRPSSSDVWELFKNNKLRPRERDTILSCNNSQAALKGYIYRVSDTLGSIIGWWPCDTSFTSPKISSLFEYTILSRNYASTVGLNEKNKLYDRVDLFPNPCSSQQTLVISAEKESELKIDLYDLMGSLIKSIYAGKISAGRTSISADIAHLSNSMYFYIIKLDGELVSKKFIKTN